MRLATFCAAFLTALATSAQAQNATITVHAGQVLHTNSPYLTGACIEDVNHEVYGGIDSQMIFGESFADPATLPPLKSFKAYDSRWTIRGDGAVEGAGRDGSKIIWDGPSSSAGEVSVDLMLNGTDGGNGGIILKVTDPGNGADAFSGYEVSLERAGFLVLGRHRQNWEPIRHVPCDVPVNQWINLAVHFDENSLDVFVNGKRITQYKDDKHPLGAGSVGLRTWHHKVLFRNFSFGAAGNAQKIPFEYEPQENLAGDVSGLWNAIQRGTANGSFSLENQNAFSGSQSQKISFNSGDGVVGIANQSLNRWGMNFIKGKRYEGYLWARAELPAKLFVALESKDGAKIYAEKTVTLKAGDWQRVDFRLKPDAADTDGQFAIELKQPGSITLGYAFLQPGSWGRFKGLPARKDVKD